MRKYFQIFLVGILAIFAVSFGGMTAFAEESVTPDKAFEIDYTILHEDGNAPSVADGFFQKPGLLLEKDGKTYLHMTIESAEMIKALSNKYGDYVLVSNNDDGTMTIQLRVPNDLSDMKLDMHIVVPAGAIPGFPGYDKEHGAILTFDSESKEENNAKDHSLKTSDGENGPSKDSEDEANKLDLSNGNYTFDVSYLHSDKEEASAMASYLADSAFVEVKGEKAEMTITVIDKDAVTKLQVDGQEPVETVEDDAGRYERFTLTNLAEITDAYVEYQVPIGDDIFEGNATFRIVLDIETKEEAEAKDKPGYVESEDPKEEPEEEENGKEDDSDKDKGEGSEEDEEVVANLVPDKAYEIMYEILHEDGNEPSVADGFFQKPGLLLEKDGKTYLHMTIESAEMIKALSNKYGDYVLVSNNDDGTMTIQLRVPNDLSDMKLDMHIVVPAGAIPGFPGYDEEHGAILTFDKNSKKEISVEGLELVATSDENNENGPYDDEETDTETPGTEIDTGDQETNPQTGVKSNLILYVLMLIGSMIPLAIKLKRRFI